jgi:YbbR domain-containing protein
MRSLRDWIIDNWLLKVVSLGLATMLWMTIASQTSAEIGLEVPLEYRNIPPQMEITGDTTNTVQVRVRGSVNVIKGVSPKDVSTTIDLRTMKAGEKIIPLTPQNVQAPFDTEVIRVSPSSVRFNLERTISKVVAVVPTILGAPASGYEIGSVLLNPAKVRVEGPESRVNTVDSVPTLAIHIDGRKSRLEQSVQLEVPDPEVRVLQTTPVAVRVEIRPKEQ